MTKDEKIDTAIAILIEKGMWKSHAYPIGYRILRKFGVALRPPAFSSFGELALGYGCYFAIAWGVIMAIVSDTPSFVFIFTAPLAGLLFGFMMAFFFKKRAKDLDLPVWDTIGA